MRRFFPHAPHGDRGLFVWLLCLAGLFAPGCVRPVQDFTEDKAGCETPTEANLIPEARMLPGRVCQTCHTQNGEAGRLIWTASGTVYPTGKSTCDTSGVDAVKVEILDAAGHTLITLITNRSGNFFTSETLTTPIRARITQGNVVREMAALQTITSCATCHQPGGAAPGGRINLN